MSFESEFAPVDEERRREFEVEVIGNRNPRIQDYLPTKDSEYYQGTLEELVLIDLEFRWSQAASSLETMPETEGVHDAPPMLESYLTEFPELNEKGVLPRLIEEEYRVRKRFDVAPNVDEYQRRFPGVELSDTLQKDELGLDTWGEESAEPGAEFNLTSRYEALEEYARGGMGVVYQARDSQIGRNVAIKHLQSHYKNDSNAFTRFVNEARLAGKLEHPGVVPVYDMGESESGTPYYSMKLVEGKTFESLINELHKRDSAAKLRDLLSVLISVSRTIAYAHDRQVIHRDLKPANIIVGNYGENIVLDWGLAKELDASEVVEDSTSTEPAIELTQVGTVMGTPAYMAPEQAKGDLSSINELTDIYALGAMLFHVLSGQPPITNREEFERLSQGSLAANALEFQKPVPEPLNAICRKAMAFKPTQRYQSANKFADELELYLADEPISAYRDPLSTKMWRWARKHSRMVTSAVFIILLASIASVAVGFVRQAQIAQRRQQISNIEAVVNTNRETALEEIRAGRFENGVSYFSKAISLCEPDPHFADVLQELTAARINAQKLVEFQTLVDRAELLAWDEIDDDAVILIHRALGLVNVFQRRDWWQHLTDFTLDPQVEDQIRNKVYRELCMLVALHIKHGAMAIESANEFVLGGNQQSQKEFTSALVPLEAAQRFRPAVGLDFSLALCLQQLEPGFINSAKLLAATSSVLDPTQTQNATDRFFIGLSLVFYDEDMAFDSDHSIVSLVNQVSSLLGAKFDLSKAGSVALEHLRNGAADEPRQLWTAFTQGWTEERVGRYQAAITAFTRCIALNPHEPRAYFHRAYEYWSLATIEEDLDQRKRYRHRAISDLQEGEHISLGNSDLLWRKTFVMLNTRDLQDLETGIPLGISAAKADAPLAELVPIEILQFFRRSNLSECLKYTESAREASAQSGDAWLLAALLKLRLEDYAEAQKCLDKALELSCEPVTAGIVAGELALHEGEWAEAKKQFSNSLKLSPEEYLARRGLALLAFAQGDHAAALKDFRELLKSAQNEWQTYECLSQSCIAAIQLGADDQLLADLKRILDRRPSAECTQIVEALESAEKTELLTQVRSLLAERAPEPIRPVAQNGESAAFLNGDFELPLNRYWHSDALQPLVWWNSGGYRSTAAATKAIKHTGNYALMIQNFGVAKQDQAGSMQQSFPTERLAKYRLSLFAKTQNLEANGLSIRAGNAASRKSVAILNIDPGTAPWKEYSATFEAKSDQTLVKIVSQNSGTVWLDDIQVTRIVDEKD